MADLKDLSEQERQRLDELCRNLLHTSQRMTRLSKETPRELLTELERRARAAEALAEELAGGDELWLPAPTVSELERHADTTGLGAAARARDPRAMAQQARALAERLRSKALTLEERRRLEYALHRAVAATSARALQRGSGRALQQALTQLKGGQVQTAASTLASMAQRFANAANRQQMQRRLAQLTRRLRAAGPRMFGKRHGQIQRLAQQPGHGLQPLGASPSLVPHALLPPGTRRMAGGPMSSAPSGLPAASGSPAPVPGMGQTMPGGASSPPVPGSGGSTQGPGLAHAGGGGMAPVPGGTGMALSTGVGGTQAGHGTAPLGGSAAQAHAASRTGAVQTAIGGDGETRQRQIEGADAQETAARERRALAVQFIAAEEDALSEEPLPLSRREHIIRYFAALRRHLQHAE